MDVNYEAKVFWIFVHIMHEKKWREVFLDRTPKLMKMLDKFKLLLKENLLDIYLHFEKHEVKKT